MAKQNLKAALANHNARKAQRAHEAKVEAAKQAKADSLKGGGGGGGGAAKKQKQKARTAQVGNGDAGVVVGEDVQKATGAVAGPSSSSKAREFPEPFEKDDTILLVGEGDFSFTLSILSSPRSHPPNRILATAFDSEQACIAKHPNAKSNIARIRQIASEYAPSPCDASTILRFGVDAGDLSADKVIRRWRNACNPQQRDRSLGGGEGSSEAKGPFTKIWFGFPHVGQGHKDEQRNVLANQLLLLRFLVSAAPLVARGRKPAYVLRNEQGGGAGAKRKRGSAGEDGEGEHDDDDDDGDEEERRVEEDGVSDLEDDGGDDEDDDGLDQEAEGTNSRPTTAKPTPKPTYTPPRPPANRAGSILITLRNTKPYTLWNVPHLGTRLSSLLPAIARSAPALPKGMRAAPTLADVARIFPLPGDATAGEADRGATPKTRDRGYDLWRSFRFSPGRWQGYTHVRTVGAAGQGEGTGSDLLRNRAEGATAEREAECRTWEFGLRT